MWRAVAGKQQLSDIPELSTGRAANQTPAHATVCKRAVAGKAAAQWGQSALQRLWPEISALNTTIKHSGVKLIRSLLHPTASTAHQQLPERHLWPTGKVQVKTTEMPSNLFSCKLFSACLTSGRTLSKSIRHEHFVLWSFFSENPFIYWTEMRFIFMWQGAVSCPWLLSHPRAFLERWEQTADKWKWSLEGQSLFWEGILVTNN